MKMLIRGLAAAWLFGSACFTHAQTKFVEDEIQYTLLESTLKAHPAGMRSVMSVAARGEPTENRWSLLTRLVFNCAAGKVIAHAVSIAPAPKEQIVRALRTPSQFDAELEKVEYRATPTGAEAFSVRGAQWSKARTTLCSKSVQNDVTSSVTWPLGKVDDDEGATIYYAVLRTAQPSARSVRLWIESRPTEVRPATPIFRQPIEAADFLSDHYPARDQAYKRLQFELQCEARTARLVAFQTRAADDQLTSDRNSDAAPRKVASGSPLESAFKAYCAGDLE